MSLYSDERAKHYDEETARQKFDKWAFQQTSISLRGPKGDVVLLLHNRLGKNWYRQTRNKKTNRYGDALYDIGLHNPAFPLQHNTLRAELEWYKSNGYQTGASATNTNINSNARPPRSNQRGRGGAGRRY